MITTRSALWLLLALVFSAQPAWAQSARLERPTATVVEVAGGAGTNAWRLRYGTRPGAPASVFSQSPDRAYFVHGPWLRLIDTSSGIVIGRWRFPNMIEAVADDGPGTIGVRFKMPPWATMREMTVHFDPSSPQPLNWDVGALITYRVAEWEAFGLIQTLSSVQDPWSQQIPGAKAAVASFDDMVRRDPSAPYFRLARAKLLRDSEDPRAATAFEDLFALPSADHTEWFRIARILDGMPGAGPKAGRAAYDRAFGDFIRRDRDPRLIDTLIGRLVLYPPGRLTEASEDDRNRYLEQLYHLAPTTEASERAWAFHADQLARKGVPEAAAWRERAAVSSRESLFLATIDIQLVRDRFLLLELGSILAALIWIVSRHIKYAPQRRMRAVAASRAGQVMKSVGHVYWSRRDRWSLLAIALVGWLAAGPAYVYGLLITRSFALPVHVGALNGFEDFEGRYPPSDERTLLQAIALQQTDQAVDAERLYRSLPQFAESWNNLGVILARAGNTDESRRAFTRALEADASLPEAVLNASGKPTTEPTRTFQTYAPDAKMIAIPARDRLMRGYLGWEWSQRYLLMLLGPSPALRLAGSLNFHPVIIAPAIMGGGFLTLLLIVSIIMLAFVPTVDVTVPPGRLSEFIEMFVPGTSAVWRWAAAVLLVWTTLAMAAVFQWLFTTPYLTIGVFQPGIMRAYGYATGLDDLNPPMAGMVAVVLTLWVINALVNRGRNR